MVKRRDIIIDLDLGVQGCLSRFIKVLNSKEKLIVYELVYEFGRRKICDVPFKEDEIHILKRKKRNKFVSKVFINEDYNILVVYRKKRMRGYF